MGKRAIHANTLSNVSAATAATAEGLRQVHGIENLLRLLCRISRRSSACSLLRIDLEFPFRNTETECDMTRKYRFGNIGLRALLMTVVAVGGTAVGVYAATPVTVVSGVGAEAATVSDIGNPDAMAVAASVATTGMAEVVVDDIDGDRADDVVAVERSTGKLWMYAGTGRVELGTGGWNGMHDLAAGDFNGDTKADLVGVEQTTGTLWLYPSGGKGLASRVEIGTGGWNGMHDLAAGEFNSDGKADIVGVEEATGKLWLYPGNGAGAIASGSARVEIGSGGWNGMHDLAAMDLGIDGKSDVIAAETSTGKLWLYKGTGTGLMTRAEIGSGAWNSMRDLAGGDFFGTEEDDLVGVEAATGRLYVYAGKATGLEPRKQIGTADW